MTQTMDPRNKTTQRIALLLNQAENASTTGEAEVYAQRAEELMLKHCLTRAAVYAALADKERTNEVITRAVFAYTGIYRQVMVMMLHEVSTALGNLRTVNMTRTGSKDEVLWVIGFESDVEHAKLLLASLQTQCLTALERWWRDASKTGLTAMQKFKDRRQFILSFGHGAAERITRARTALQDSAGTGTALVLRDRRSAVDRFMEQFDLVSRSTALVLGNVDAHVAGLRSGLSSNTSDTPVGGGRLTIEGSR